MASVCMTQANFQQQQHHFQLMSNNIMLLQQQQHHQHQNQHQNHQHQNHQQHLQYKPATTTTKVLGTSNLQNIQPHGRLAMSLLPNKKKYTYANMPFGEQLPSVARRNARERNRVKQVNNGYANLRQHLPQSVINALSNGGRGASKKLSKVDTLRIAVEYIRGLQDLLDDEQPAGAHSGSTGAAIISLDESSNDGDYDYSSLGSPCETQSQLPHSFHSETSASPTPSYSDSDISMGGINYMQPLKLMEPQPQPQPPSQPQPTAQPQAQSQEVHFKFEPFDSFDSPLGDSDDQPDDEELLDYISSWQEQ